ncbi:DUF2783 domain-containing protein [Roseovarius rhodophyticola]|uniref:DUF2783 domain-containing protein n=1 Tax=Roseovarius rhodophyticola TaxID=3080827 RepID=A0ABZ2TJ97_9RHOB|nr:DUF2783 domain-containing protein [Roseovarius sp. W115]MDV2929697.1 DUF2783 domain-containing protein [Roseovarius sp. W115]
MSTLITTPNLKNADDIYAMLLAAHEDLSLEDSTALNARLVLLLVNHIGDAGVIEEALEIAKQG